MKKTNAMIKKALYTVTNEKEFSALWKKILSIVFLLVSSLFFSFLRVSQHVI